MSKSRKIDIPLKLCVDARLVAEIEETGDICGLGQSDVIRAALRLGLPALRSIPGIAPLLQPGVLRTSTD